MERRHALGGLLYINTPALGGPIICYGLDDVSKEPILDAIRIGEWLLNCVHRYTQRVLPNWLERTLRRFVAITFSLA